jgi:hypothetical protein
LRPPRQLPGARARRSRGLARADSRRGSLLARPNQPLLELAYGVGDPEPARPAGCEEALDLGFYQLSTSVLEGAEHAVLAAAGGAGEKHLSRVDVALGDRSLRVTGLKLHVRLRVPGGRLARKRGMPKSVPGPERLDDLRAGERRAQKARESGPFL